MRRGGAAADRCSKAPSPSLGRKSLGKRPACSWPDPTQSPTRAEPAVQVERGAYQPDVSECLWEVAERFATRTRLLGVQAEVVGVGQHLLEDEAGLLGAARPGQCFHQPERTHIERPLAPGQAVAGSSADLVAVH